MKVKVKTDWLDCYGEDERVCPYCGNRQTDSWEWGDGEYSADVDCGNCGRTFYAERQIAITYNSWPNDDTSDWQEGDVFEDGLSEEDEAWANEQEKHTGRYPAIYQGMDNVWIASVTTRDTMYKVRAESLEEVLEAWNESIYNSR